MNEITTLSGTVSGVRLDSSITVNTTVSGPQGAASGAATVSSQTVRKETMNFRVDNRPAYMPVAINIANGDMVTAAGLQKGEFETIAVHNHTTKTVYWTPEQPTYPEIIYIVLGFCFTGFYGLGWVLIIGGVLFLNNKTSKNNRIKAARAMVQKAQAPVMKV